MRKTWQPEAVEYVTSVVQQKFWIPGLKNAMRSMKRDCVQCKKLARAMDPRTSDIPVSRLKGMAYPVRKLGLDYFGPFQVKYFRKSVRKWIFLFICFSSKIVPLEILSTLDTQSCLDAVHKFAARRRCPKTILSNNHTFFVGSARRFRELFTALSGNQLEENATKFGFNLTFSPRGALHFGVVFERLVRS